MSKINTKPEQFDALIEIMEKNRDFAKGYVKTAQAKTKSNNLWKQIELELNLLGPPVKDVEGWKRVWATYKDSLKKKIRRNKQSISGTGGGPSKYVPLTPKEEKLVQILNMELSFSGVDHAKSFGPSSNVTVSNGPSISTSQTIDDDFYTDIQYLTEHNTSMENNILINDASAVPPPANATPRSRARKKSAEKQNMTNLLEKQIAQQKEFHVSINEKLGSIRRSLKDLHKTELKKIELQKESNKIQKYYLKIIKKQNDESNRLQYEKLKIKKRTIEIEEIKLNLA